MFATLRPKSHTETLMTPEPIEVTDDTFETLVLGSPTPIVIEFYARWCGPSRRPTPKAVQVAASIPGCRLARIDVDANPVTTAKQGVKLIPCYRVFDGESSANALAVR